MCSKFFPREEAEKHRDPNVLEHVMDRDKPMFLFNQKAVGQVNSGFTPSFSMVNIQ